VIDLHCHVLPGIDDGARSLEEAAALARAAQLDGTQTLVATPHVSSHYPNDADTIAGLAAELTALLAGEPTPAPKIYPGAEIAATRVMETRPDELARLGLGGGSWLLIEPPLTAVATGLELVVADLQRRGHGVVLAHPERCAAFHREPRLLQALVASGALTSVTAGSFAGRFGAVVHRYAWSLLEAGLVHNVASDFHDATGRPPGIAAELDKAGLTPVADWLAQQVPAAILGDHEIPPRPSVRLPALEGRRRWWEWRRGGARSKRAW
jgi:protein-tyrosine phosphatase